MSTLYLTSVHGKMGRLASFKLSFEHDDNIRILLATLSFDLTYSFSLPNMN